MRKPELLAPAKNLERLKVAILYGADAVYVGGQRYGLRARADNFTDEELQTAVAFAHEHGAKVYITLNAFLHDDDFEGFAAYCQFLEKIGIDAVIVSDLGVLRQVQAHSQLDIHLSTQASCLNTSAARMWRQIGVQRLILGRELTIDEAKQIHQEAGADVEIFVHGAMCMAYSGRCTISNFTAGRDSNRGGCSQSCRFTYEARPSQQPGTGLLDKLDDAEHLNAEIQATTLLSSKDLWGISQIPAMFDAGICSLKIEGRMKSSLYVATTCKVYRMLIDAYAAGDWSPALLQQAEAELNAVPHRDYFAGSLDIPAEHTGEESVFLRGDGINEGTHKAAGIVLEATSQQLILKTTMPLHQGDTIEFLPFTQTPIRHTIEQMSNVAGESLQRAQQDSVICLPQSPHLRDISRDAVIRMAHLTDALAAS